MPSRRPNASEQRLWLGANRYCSGRRDSGANTERFAHSSINRYAVRRYDSNSDSDPNGNADPDWDSSSDGYPHARPDHAQCAWLQSAGSANGGPLMGRRDLKQH